MRPMSDIDANIVYEVLKKIQNRLGVVADDVQDIKHRMVTMETYITARLSAKMRA